MNTKALVFAVAAACIGSAAPAFAKNYDRDHDHRYEQRDERRAERREDRREYREDQRERREMRREVRQEVRREVRAEMRDHNRSYRGAGPRHDLYRGGRLPSVYHGDRYVVRDYHRYNLSAPPRGTHWVRAGNDYLLVALATGIIAQVLLN